MSNDPWKHRSSSMNCSTCMWNVVKVTVLKVEEDKNDRVIRPGSLVMAAPIQVGRCRRHAPTMNGYPVVFSNDWCGDHTLDENKI